MGMVKNFLFGLVGVLSPTVFYDLFIEIALDLSDGDPATLKIFLIIFYAIFAFILVVLIYENTVIKNKFMIIFLEILVSIG